MSNKITNLLKFHVQFYRFSCLNTKSTRVSQSCIGTRVNYQVPQRIAEFSLSPGELWGTIPAQSLFLGTLENFGELSRNHYTASVFFCNRKKQFLLRVEGSWNPDPSKSIIIIDSNISENTVFLKWFGELEKVSEASGNMLGNFGELLGNFLYIKAKY